MAALRSVRDAAAGLAVIESIAHSTRSLFGPFRALKCVSSADESEDAFVFDALGVLEAVHIEHPAAALLHDAARVQETSLGSGTTTLVMLAGLLSAACRRLLDGGVPACVLLHSPSLSSATRCARTAIAHGLQEAVAVFERCCEAAAVTVTAPDDDDDDDDDDGDDTAWFFDDDSRSSSSSSSSDTLHTLARLLDHADGEDSRVWALAADAVRALGGGGVPDIAFAGLDGAILCDSVVQLTPGGAVGVHPGAVLLPLADSAVDAAARAITGSGAAVPASVLVVDGALGRRAPADHDGVAVAASGAALHAIAAAAEDRLAAAMRAVASAEGRPVVVLVGGGVDMRLMAAAVAAGSLVVPDVPHALLRAVPRLLNTRALPPAEFLDAARPPCGALARLSRLAGGATACARLVLAADAPRLCTVRLCEATRLQCRRTERRLRRCVRRLVGVLTTGRAVPGGGLIDIRGAWMLDAEAAAREVANGGGDTDNGDDRVLHAPAVLRAVAECLRSLAALGAANVAAGRGAAGGPGAAEAAVVQCEAALRRDDSVGRLRGVPLGAVAAQLAAWPRPTAPEVCLDDAAARVGALRRAAGVVTLVMRSDRVIVGAE